MASPLRLLAVGSSPGQINETASEEKAMNKLLCTAALVAAALFVGSSDAHAQVVRLSNHNYRPALVRPGAVVGNVRVVSPNYNYNYGYGYTSPYRYSNYYGYNNY